MRLLSRYSVPFRRFDDRFTPSRLNGFLQRRRFPLIAAASYRCASLLLIRCGLLLRYSMSDIRHADEYNDTASAVPSSGFCFFGSRRVFVATSEPRQERADILAAYYCAYYK